jgi:hypothetical protein
MTHDERAAVAAMRGAMAEALRTTGAVQLGGREAKRALARVLGAVERGLFSRPSLDAALRTTLKRERGALLSDDAERTFEQFLTVHTSTQIEMHPFGIDTASGPVRVFGSARAVEIV